MSEDRGGFLLLLRYGGDVAMELIEHVSWRGELGAIFGRFCFLVDSLEVIHSSKFG